MTKQEARFLWNQVILTDPTRPLVAMANGGKWLPELYPGVGTEQAARNDVAARFLEEWAAALRNEEVADADDYGPDIRTVSTGTDPSEQIA